MKNHKKVLKSTKEINRFFALDQNGVQHTIVERAMIHQHIGAVGQLVVSQLGPSKFYSATSGDQMSRLPDGKFEPYSN